MNESIRRQIKTMAEEDQRTRINFVEKDEPWDSSLDEKHAEKLKNIVEKTGVITLSMGEEIHDNAWLLVQHADHDVEWQEWYLDQLKSLPENEVKRTHIAYLEDRVRLNKGLPQLYGTQFIQQADGSFEPYEIEKPEQVEQLRAKMGLSTLAEARKRNNA